MAFYHIMSSQFILVLFYILAPLLFSYILAVDYVFRIQLSVSEGL